MKITKEGFEQKKQLILNDIQEMINQRGKISTVEYYKDGKYSGYEVFHYLGGWKKALDMLGYKFEVHNGVSKEDLLTDILEVKKRINPQKMLINIYLEHGKYSKAPIKKHGGWNFLLKELGLEINMYKNIKKEDIIKDFQQFYEKYHTCNSVIYRKYGSYNQGPIDRLFGSYVKMVEEAGFTPMRIGKHLSDENMLNIIWDIYIDKGFLSSVAIDRYAPFRYATVYNRFGGMSKIYERLHLEKKYVNTKKFKAADDVIELAAKILNEEPIKEYTNDYLVNPEETSHLYVDAYFPNNNIILEYDGEQHFHFVPYIHKTIEKFNRNQLLDIHKENIIKSLNIRLIRIRYDEKITEELIRQKLNEI